MATPQIQVVLADETIPENLRQALQRSAAAASFWPLSQALRAGPPVNADAIVVVVPEDTRPLAGPLRVLFERLADHPRGVLVLTSNGRPVRPLPHPPSLPIAFDAGGDEHDLTVRLGAILEMRESLDTLHRRMLADRRNGESVARRYARQLRLASQVQREFLPDTLPRVGPISFDVLFRPVDYVSGDIYDVRRLDEDHLGIAVADATGHGIPAALLTVYIKRALRGKEIENGAYRILAPDEVLSRLNEDIYEAQLSECQFVAAAYAVLNTRTLELQLARGGAPYPLYRRGCGAVHPLGALGGVVGVSPSAGFELIRLRLVPGDSLILYTDGLERIVAPHTTLGEAPEAIRRQALHIEAEQESALAGAVVAGMSDGGTGTAAGTVAAPPALTPEVAAHDLVTGSAWCRTLSIDGPSAALRQADGRQRALRRMGHPLDDLTVLCLSIDS